MATNAFVIIFALSVWISIVLIRTAPDTPAGRICREWMVAHASRWVSWRMVTLIVMAMVATQLLPIVGADTAAFITGMDLTMAGDLAMATLAILAGRLSLRRRKKHNDPDALANAPSPRSDETTA